MEVLSISQFPDFWLLFWRSLYHQLFIPSLLFYRSVSACLPHPTFHAWISFHLTKRAVSQLTPCLAADKYINCAHLCLASSAGPISVSITYLPFFCTFIQLSPVICWNCCTFEVDFLPRLAGNEMQINPQSVSRGQGGGQAPLYFPLMKIIGPRLQTFFQSTGYICKWIFSVRW